MGVGPILSFPPSLLTYFPPPAPVRPEEALSEIPVLPREVLQVLSQRLAQCVGQGPRLGQALLLLKFFIIICRWVQDPPPIA